MGIKKNWVQTDMTPVTNYQTKTWPITLCWLSLFSVFLVWLQGNTRWVSRILNWSIMKKNNIVFTSPAPGWHERQTEDFDSSPMKLSKPFTTGLMLNNKPFPGLNYRCDEAGGGPRILETQEDSFEEDSQSQMTEDSVRLILSNSSARPFLHFGSPPLDSIWAIRSIKDSNSISPSRTFSVNFFLCGACSKYLQNSSSMFTKNHNIFILIRPKLQTTLWRDCVWCNSRLSVHVFFL